MILPRIREVCLLRLLFLTLLSLLVIVMPLRAQTGSVPCAERPTVLYEPWIQAGIACLELVTPAHYQSALAYFALTAAPDGSLYAVRPFTGELVHLTDDDGDGLPETPTVIADGLTMPAGLWLEGDALYIVGGSNVYRFQAGEITLVSNALSVRDHWNSAIMLADGEIVTQVDALDHEAGFTWLDGALYAADADTDALYRVNGEQVEQVVSFAEGANPASLAVYRGDAIPSLIGSMLVVLRGSDDPLNLGGYRVVSVDPQAGTWQPLMPARPDPDPRSDFTLDEMNYRGSGFFPNRPLAVTVNDAGWVYISISDGRVLVLRPQ